MSKIISKFIWAFIYYLAVLSVTAVALGMINRHVVQETPGPGQVKILPAATAQP